LEALDGRAALRSSGRWRAQHKSKLGTINPPKASKAESKSKDEAKQESKADRRPRRRATVDGAP